MARSQRVGRRGKLEERRRAFAEDLSPGTKEEFAIRSRGARPKRAAGGYAGDTGNGLPTLLGAQPQKKLVWEWRGHRRFRGLGRLRRQAGRKLLHDPGERTGDTRELFGDLLPLRRFGDGGARSLGDAAGLLEGVQDRLREMHADRGGFLLLLDRAAGVGEQASRLFLRA